MGDDSEIPVKGIGKIDLDNGYFNNVLYVPDLAANLLSTYQMKHTGSTKRATFIQEYVETSEISIGKVVAVGIAHHDSRMYKFHSCFLTPHGMFSYNIPMILERYGMRSLYTSNTYIFKL